MLYSCTGPYGASERSENGVTERTYYRNAPIIEATISFGVVTPPELTAVDLEAIRELVKDRYPAGGEEYLYSGEVSIPKPGGPPQHDDVHEHMGYTFVTEDGKQIFRARIDSFNFSVMQPYGSWESFRREARRLWDLFKEVSGVEEISRVAVRYINQINIPTSVSANLDEYLNVYPEIPDNMPSGLVTNSFFMQVQLWQSDLDCMLVINEAPGLPPDENIASVRLDFDLFQERYGNPRKVDDDVELWDYLEKLRDRKNDVFEASITEKTRRLIK